MRHSLLLLPLLAAACAPAGQPANDGLSQRPAAIVECLRETGATMLAAHRAGPRAGLPENAISTIRANAGLGVLYAEIDVAQTADGQLFLMHDDTLDRTTTGSGRYDDRDWSEIAGLQLVDDDGNTVAETIPTLSDAFAAARDTGLALNLDMKNVEIAQIVDAIHAENAQDLALIIAYTVEQAAEIHALDSSLTLSAPNRPDELAAAGVDLDQVYLWLGVRLPDAAEDAVLAERGLETSAGLFRLEDGTPGIYQQAREAGIEILSVDDVPTAVAALGGPDVLQNQIDACTVN
ncbi:glycerophosphodiester phosphodiesterase family protein [Maricaulis sp.]|uniref:glycerophosphodiester phosphodiesterase family protein n=1 Tax=Maricaulis sp. TaxID=1486257 RepID=UPI002614D0F3|nr:glycerophosphodiester phosphodiesterase family protein [Maricaulis sp.]